MDKRNFIPIVGYYFLCKEDPGTFWALLTIFAQAVYIAIPLGYYLSSFPW